jgi:rhamnosyltransferase
MSHIQHPEGIKIPLVLVLIAAYNGLRWLPEQVDSILNQESVRVRILISVDASVDGTEKWVDELALSDDRITVLPHGMRFGGAAPNFFRLLRDADLSDVDFVSLADQDDVWMPNKLNRAVEVLHKTNADAYSSDAIAFWSDGMQLRVRKSQAQVEWDFLFEAAGPGCTYILRKALAKKLKFKLRNQVGRTNQIELHDWFIYAYARTHQYRWVIDDQAHIFYRQHEHNQVGVNQGIAGFLYRYRKVWGGRAIGQVILIADLIGVKNTVFIRTHLNKSRMGFLRLAFCARQCRRRLRDQFVFALMCLLLAIKGHV